MNKGEVIRRVAEISEVDTTICNKVVNALEKVLNDELSSSRGASNTLDLIYKIIGLLKNK